MVQENKRLVIIVSAVAFVLSIPLIAMQFTTEVNWTLLDFVVMGFLLLSTGLLCELILRKVRQTKYRIILCGGLLLALCLLWIELAVGIFGSPIAGS